MITSHMHIKAPGFPRHSKDNDMVNNFMSGFALADAIKTELIRQKYQNVDLIDEDYGWIVSAVDKRSGLELGVTLSSLADPEDSPNTVVELMVGITPQTLHKGWLWWKRDISSGVREHSETVFGFLRTTLGIEVVQEFHDIK